MNVLLCNLASGGLAETLQQLHEASHGKGHTLVEDPSAADLILLSGLEGRDPWSLTSHPLFVSYPNKCAVFSEDDIYLPLLPGIYCSPRKGLSCKLGRTRSFSYISRHAGYGNPYIRPLAMDKDLLFSFQGASTSFVRKRLFRMKATRKDILIENTSNYWNWDRIADRASAQRRYTETIARSRFVLCPRGSGTGSHRLFEVMSMGVAPVLLADDYALPTGPSWDSFLIQVREREVHNLPEILESHSAESEQRGCRAREEWINWFSAEHEFDHIVDACQATLSSQLSALFRILRPVMIVRHKTGLLARRTLRSSVLKAFKAFDIPFPFALRGHDK